MSIHRFALAASFLLGQVSASTPAASSPVRSSQAHVPTVSCRTELGLNSVKSVPTTTVTRVAHDHTPVVIYSTVQDTVTVTPSTSTATATEYDTTTITSTADTITDTFSTTSTEYDTATVTLTDDPVTVTVYTTISSTSTSISTISTSSGFTPIVDTFATPTAVKRSLDEDENCSPWLDEYKYPQKVECYEKVVLKTTSISTVTESPSTTTAATPSTTVTETSTITSNSVVVPSDVSTTLSYSTTSTITETTLVAGETTTVTSTTTAVVSTATASFYEACAANNIATSPLTSDYGSYAGKYINVVQFTRISGEGMSVGSTDTAYDCCVSCIQTSDCALSYFMAVSGGSNYCYVITTTTCSATSNYATVYTYGNPTTINLANGNCGHYVGTEAPL
ncbi:uncharacterized protein N7477_000978 [Penicillium maclennaniae]|uniref:uncharacterized protein n=1 Tax=Penicillium maclennaniae TaxID=1343394 RepID=UPI00253FC238|nr:uncharacterized protein N7477_000978 [Penicillium maclennaniae]KAJ5684633.1 hypothetical protein N7477_000978 [Penicillium maclennaniae]